MKMRICLGCGLTVGFLAFAADPVVSVTGMTQDADTRAVTISYTLANAPAVVTLDIQTNAVVEGSTVWASIGGGAHIQNFDPGSAVFKKIAEDGAYTIIWHPDRSWPDNLVANGGARAVMTAWAMNDTPDYMVVPLIATYGGETEYYPDETYLPQGLLGNVRYRTSTLVMRRIHARNIPWTMGGVMVPGQAASAEAHSAMLTNDYYIGVFPITQTQWSIVGSEIPSSNVFSNEGARAMRPINYITRGNCRYNSRGDWPLPPGGTSFLGRLRTRTGLDFDLPTEGEWEFACRVGGQVAEGQWNDGSAILAATDEADANLPGRNKYNGGSDATVTVDEDGGTAIVGSYAPNAWGLYDMHGNVWEWCLDWYSTDISAYGGLICTTCSLSTTQFSLRGGCGATGLLNNIAVARSSNKYNEYNKWYGVRVVCRAGLR